MNAGRGVPGQAGVPVTEGTADAAEAGELAALFVRGSTAEVAGRLNGLEPWVVLERLTAVDGALSEARISVAAKRAAVYRALTEQYSIAQIAQRMGVSRQSVHQALARDAERRGKVNEQLI